MSDKPLKLAICIPSTGMWHADFGFALCQMISYCHSALFFESETREVIFIDKRTSNLPRSRQECLEDAILQECTHALFLDTDQTFPADTAHRLLRWKKQCVACNIPLKVLPSFPTARARSAGPFGTPIYSNGNQAQGLEQVWRVGSGVMLIELAALENIEKPWFEIPYSQKHHQFIGEDWYFVEKLEKAGVPVYVDHELSRLVGHVGIFHFTHAHIPSFEESQAA